MKDLSSLIGPEPNLLKLSLKTINLIKVRVMLTEEPRRIKLNNIIPKIRNPIDVASEQATQSNLDL